MRIGIDLGGTKIAAVALDDDGRELARHRRPTPRDDYDGTLDAIADLVHRLEADLGRPGSVGVGTPGAISPTTGRLRNANSVWLNGRRLDHDLSQALSRPVRIANDADCFTLSEAHDGSAADARTVFGVIIGTGTGGGFCVDGRLLTGPNAIAGEWGHNPLPWPTPDELPGPRCYCGKHGCIETFLSGPGLAADHARVTGEMRDANTIASAAVRGDRAAKATLGRHAERMARALATVINLVDPDVIVLGGGLSNLVNLYRVLPGQILRYLFAERLATRIVPPRHGDDSGVRGAAWLWPSGRA
jgi:fructokinase